LGGFAFESVDWQGDTFKLIYGVVDKMGFYKTIYKQMRGAIPFLFRYGVEPRGLK